MRENYLEDFKSWLRDYNQRSNIKVAVIVAVCVVALIAAVCAVVYFVRGCDCCDDDFYDFEDDFDDEFDDEEDLFVD